LKYFSVKFWSNLSVSPIFCLITKADKLKIFFLFIIQVLLVFLDIFGVLLLGLLAYVATSGQDLSKNSGFVSEILRTSGLLKLPYSNLVIAIGVVAVIILGLKTFFSLIVLRRMSAFLSIRSSKVTGFLIKKYLSAPLLFMQQRSFQTSISILNYGIPKLFFEVIFRIIIMFGDLVLFVFMLGTLFLVNRFIAVSTLAIFGAVGVALFFLMRVLSTNKAKIKWELEVRSNQDVFQVLSLFRENFVKNRLDFFSREIGKTRLEHANSAAVLNFLPYVSKYLFEMAVVVSTLFVAILQFCFGNKEETAIILGLFVGAASRLAPASLRLQQGAVELNANFAAIEPTLELIRELDQFDLMSSATDDLDFLHRGFDPRIVLQNVSFTYPGATDPTLRDISINLEAGKTYAIVGKSGAGKSTLIDLILGLLNPDSGKVEISGLPPRDSIQKWSGAIGYVPQEVVMINGTICENISLGYPVNENTMHLAEKAAKVAQLDVLISQLPLGINSPVGDRGSKVSGGQRQRLGIARAMYTEPKLLVLDEATSSLDGQTEENVAASILQGTNMTVLTIAHRVSTIVKADAVIYLDGGSVRTMGTFEEVRQLVPDFENQISLMGVK